MKHLFQYYKDCCLSYAEYGDKNGNPILIQHGMIASINDHQLFHWLIASRARVICLARPGYGESSPYEMKNVGEWGEIVSGLVKTLGLVQLDVLGISSGAPYSYATAYHLPEQVRRLFILSGTPALFDDQVRAHWPYPITENASIAEMQQLAFDLFFAQRSKEELEQDDIRDSMRNHCFGIAQDLRIRCTDWGFPLAGIQAPVTMRHSRVDEAVPLVTAQRTASMLPNCRLEIREKDPHFSQEVLDDFINQITE